MRLYIDDVMAAEARFKTQSGHYAICGEGLCIGRDGGDAVSKAYESQYPFRGGAVLKVVYDVADDVYVDIEQKFAAAIARD
jgi:arylsulfatase